MKTVGVVANVLLVVGGLNWGLWGLFGLDLVDLLLGSIPLLATVVYVLVGVSAVVKLFAWNADCGCKPTSNPTM